MESYGAYVTPNKILTFLQRRIASGHYTGYVLKDGGLPKPVSRRAGSQSASIASRSPRYGGVSGADRRRSGEPDPPCTSAAGSRSARLYPRRGVLRRSRPDNEGRLHSATAVHSVGRVRSTGLERQRGRISWEPHGGSGPSADA